MGLDVFSLIGLSTGSMRGEFLMGVFSWAPWGFDELGRNIFFRWLEALFWTSGVAFTAGFWALSLAGILSLLHFSAWARRGLLVFLNQLQSLPSFLLAGIALMLLRDLRIPGFLQLTFVCGFSVLPTLLRHSLQILSSHQVQSLRVASELLGSSIWFFFRHHLLGIWIRGIAPTLFLVMHQLMLFESLLSFVGLGAHGGHVSLGLLFAESWAQGFRNPSLLLLPGLSLSVLGILVVWGAQYGKRFSAEDSVKLSTAKLTK